MFKFIMKINHLNNTPRVTDWCFYDTKIYIVDVFFLSLTFQALISHPIQTNFLINDTQKCNKTTCIVFDTNVIYYSDRYNHYNDFLIITQINTNNIWLFNLKQNRFWLNISVIFSFLKSHCTNWNSAYIYTIHFLIIMTNKTIQISM